MRNFIAANPGLESRFTRTIDFPAYEQDELVKILRLLASQSGYTLPEELETKLKPWIESNRKRESWGNARERCAPCLNMHVMRKQCASVKTQWLT